MKHRIRVLFLTFITSFLMAVSASADYPENSPGETVNVWDLSFELDSLTTGQQCSDFYYSFQNNDLFSDVLAVLLYHIHPNTYDVINAELNLPAVDNWGSGESFYDCSKKLLYLLDEDALSFDDVKLEILEKEDVSGETIYRFKTYDNKPAMQDGEQFDLQFGGKIVDDCMVLGIQLRSHDSTDQSVKYLNSILSSIKQKQTQSQESNYVDEAIKTEPADDTIKTSESVLDIESMSREELLELRDRINILLANDNTVSAEVNASDDCIIYDQHNVVITVTGVNQNECNLLVENNSEKDYDFAVHSMAINGVMTNCNPYYGSTDIPAGKKATISLDLHSHLLEHAPNDEFNNIDFVFWFYDNAVSYKDFATETIRYSINPAVTENSFPMGSDITESCGLKISLTSFTNESITMAIINTNSYNVDIDLREVSINGWAYDTGLELFDDSIFSNCELTYTLNIDPDFKTRCDITDINNFECKLAVREDGDHFKENLTESLVFSN